MRPSLLTLGTVQTGLSYGVANTTGQPGPAMAAAIYEAALASGITTFDTARAYGEAETRIGAWLKAGGGPVSIVSKVAAAPAHADMADWVRQQISLSLDTLHQPRMACALLHRASDLLQPGCRTALEAVKAAGLIGGFGVSAYDAESLAAAVATGPLDAVQVPVNLFDMRLADQGWLERLHDSGCSVYVRSVFLQGLLLMSPERLPAALRQAGRPLHDLHAIAAGEGLSMTSLALGLVRDLPGVTSLVVGAETPEQIRDTAAALPDAPLGNQLRRKVAAAIADIPDWLRNPATWPKEHHAPKS